MKIKLAVLDQDKIFLSRLSMVFTNKYSDKIEIYSFTEKDTALRCLESERIDVFLVDDIFEVQEEEVPSRCVFAYFVENAEIDTIRGVVAVAKFQKAELLYKQILGLYAEKVSTITGFKINDETTSQIITFLSVSGGVGSSTMAAAFAKYLARAGKKALYLNFEKFGSTNNFFSGEGQFDFSDVIYAIKSKKNNLSIKLESTVKQDSSGVYFYESPRMALDMMELNAEDVKILIQKLRVESDYAYIILDIDFCMDKREKEILLLSNKVVFVNDGTDISNMKFKRAYDSFSVLDEQSEGHFFRKANLIYNKFSSKTCKKLDGIGLKEIGGAPRFVHATTEQIMEQLVAMQMFQGLL